MKRISILLIMLMAMFVPLAMNGQNQNITWNFNSNVTNGTMECGSSFTMSGSAQGRNAIDRTYVLTSTSADRPITVTCTSLTSSNNNNANAHVYVYEGNGTSGTQLANWTPSSYSSVATSTAGIITVRITRTATNQNRTVSYSLTINQDCCPTPTNVSVPNNSIGATSAVVNWSGESDNYNIRYKPASAVSESINYDFEDGFDDWTTIDANNDGDNWTRSSILMAGYNIPAHSGSDGLSSASYNNGAITPDNWLISPQVPLGGSFTMWAMAQDADYPAEHFGIYVSTTGNTNTNDFTLVYETTLTAKGTRSGNNLTRNSKGNRASGAWYDFTVDLSSYANQNGYIAVRHFGCSDQFYLNVDDFTIEEPVWTTTTSNTTSVTLNNLTPNTQYVVQVQANCGNNDLSQWSESINFTTSNVTTYSVNAASGITGGSLSFTANGGHDIYTSLTDVTAGTDVIIYVEPDAGFQLSGTPTLSPSGITLTSNADGTYTFTMPASDVTVNATFNCTTPADPTFSVTTGTYTTVQNVSISCATAGSTIYYTIDGSTPTNSSTQYTGAITINETTTLKAIAYIGTCTSNVTTEIYTIDLPTYTVTCASGLTGGSLSASPTSAVEGSTITVTATLESGYFLGTITATDGNSNDVPVTVSGNQGTFTMPASNVTVTATFTQGFRVTLNQTPNGTISADQTTNLQPGDIVTLTATPDNDCVFLAWYAYKDGDPRDVISLVNNSWFFMPSSNVTVQAVFVTEEEHEQTVGGGNNTNGNLPTNVYMKYSLTQQIYTAAEIGYNGRITAIAFKANGSATRTLDVYMAHTSKTAFSSTTDWQTMGPSFLVYSGSVSFNSSDWTTITLDTPFEYDGTSNLNICVVDKTGSWVTNITFNTYSTNANRAMYVNSDETDYSQGVNASGISDYTGTRSTVNNQIKFTIKVPGSAESLTISMDISKGFRYVENHGPSHADKLDVVGVDLENDITITAPTNFEVCLTEDGTYTSSLTIPRETSKGNRSATTWDFDSGLEGWTANDEDGDGHNWEQSTSFDAYNESAGCVVSASYINQVGALTPNNWLVSPQVELGGTFSLYAIAQDQAWPQEHFGIYVSTTGANPSDFTMLGEWTLAAGDWRQYSVDLRAFAGQNGYIAVRHFDCTDKYYIKVDHFVLDTDAHIEIEMPVTITPATVYVRMKAGLSAGNYSGTLTASAGSGDNINNSVNLRGEVIASNTWPTTVTSLSAATPGYSESGSNITISNENGLAWLISTVNGLNGQSTVLSGKTITLTADVDMSAHDWVPIGTTERPFTCTFDGNGHIITGVTCSTEVQHKGLFGYVSGAANIQNVVVQAELSGNSTTMGAIAGTFASTGTISNVEGAGTLTGGASTSSMGGLVGNKTGGTIHSSFAVNTITSANATTHVGGLVGNNIGNLYNSYANTTISGSGQIGGLAGKNNGTVENCYAVVGSQTFPAFAYENAEGGTIQYCYADNANGYVTITAGGSPTPVLQGHGTYGTVKDRKEIGYMYDDNAVTLVSGTSNYVHTGDITYTDNHLINWNGLLWSLNQWVNQDNTHANTYTPWFRPTSNLINGDLPVLGFTSDNCLGTTDADGKYLRYGSIYNTNGLDKLLHYFNENEEEVNNAASSLFLYGNATEVTKVPESQVKLFVNEDAVLIQADGADDFINTTVGVTFDNSCKTAHAYGGVGLDYDWHLMSTPLSNAKIGATYKSTNSSGTYIPNGEEYSSEVDISSLTDGYFPNGLTMGSGYDEGIKWDFYNYFEPEYHWINLKRNKKNHFHREVIEGQVLDRPYQTDELGKHYQINYTGTDQSDTKASSGDDGCVFTPGKGYMMAISQDSYMSSTGTLNKGDVKISVTKTIQNPDWEGYFDQGANLIGNPYQAYLDLEEVASGTSYSTFFVYVAEEDKYMPYHKDQSSNTWTPSQYIHPHQAFFVQKAENDNETFTFTKDMATATKEDHSYFRGEHIDYPLINLHLENAEGAKNYAIIEVNRPEEGGAGKVDALNNANFDLYTRYNQKDYKLFFTPAGVERVAVFFKTEEDGIFTFTWNTQNGKFDMLKLIDNITGAEYDMLTHDSYTFEGKATDFAARFYIAFNAPESEEPNEEEHDHFAYFNGSGWVIEGHGQLELIDMTGRVLNSQLVSGKQTTVYYNNYAAGTYLLRLVKNNKDIKTQKIVVY